MEDVINPGLGSAGISWNHETNQEFLMAGTCDFQLASFGKKMQLNEEVRVVWKRSRVTKQTWK